MLVERVMKVSSEREEQIKIFALAAEKTVSIPPSPSSRSPPTDMFDDGTNATAYSVAAYDKMNTQKKE